MTSLQTRGNSLRRHIGTRCLGCDEEEEKKREGIDLGAYLPLCSRTSSPAAERARQGTTDVSHFQQELQQSEHGRRRKTSATRGPTLPNSGACKSTKLATAQICGYVGRYARSNGKDVELNGDN